MDRPTGLAAELERVDRAGLAMAHGDRVKGSPGAGGQRARTARGGRHPWVPRHRQHLRYAERAGLAAGAPQAAESHTTCPCRVTTTSTEPTPYGSVHAAGEVETA